MKSAQSRRLQTSSSLAGKLRIPVSRNRAVWFRPWNERGWLLDWLNRSDRGTQKARVLQLIVNLRKVREISRPVFYFDDLGLGRIPKLRVPGFDLRKKINSQLRRSKVTLRAEGYSRSDVEARPLAGQIIWRWYEEENPESKATFVLARLEEEGLFDLLRRCIQCRMWFYAERDWHRFCTPACRDKNFRSTPEGRKKRADYMRKYRARERRMNDNFARKAKRELSGSPKQQSPKRQSVDRKSRN